MDDSPPAWRIDSTSARLHTRGLTVDIVIDRVDLEIETCQGHGSMRQETRATVPMKVLKELLDQAGYDVKARG